MEIDTWKEETNLLEKEGSQHFWGAPQVVEFDGWKEEAAKFLTSLYQNGHLWLNFPNGITGGMIHKITGIPHGRTPMPKNIHHSDWIQTLAGGTSGEN
jgi:hypothetical protein